MTRLKSIQAMLLSLKPSLSTQAVIAVVTVLLQVGSAQNNPATQNATQKQNNIQSRRQLSAYRQLIPQAN